VRSLPGLVALGLFFVPLLAHPQVPKAPPTSGPTGAFKQHFLWKKLEDRIGEIDRGLDGILGVAILDLTSGQEYLLHGDEIFAQASSIKIPVLVELYRQSQDNSKGPAKLTDLYSVRHSDLVPDSDIMLGLTPGVTQITNRDLATMMVAVSDNSATNVLIDRVGMENVNSTLHRLGLKETRLRRKMMDLKAAQEGRENISTPREMMRLLQALYQQKVLNKAMTEDFFKVLATHKDSALLRGLPADVRSANKPGALEGVRNDSGIVFVPNRPFVLCIMATYLHNEKEGEKAITDITAAAYSYFDRLGRASEYGRVISAGIGGPSAH
jgi:beta-lactamase class A